MWQFSWIVGRMLDRFERIGEVMSRWHMTLPVALVALVIPFVSPSFDVTFAAQQVWCAIPVLASMGSMIRREGMPDKAEVFRLQRMAIPFVAGLIGILIAGPVAEPGAGLPPSI